MRYKTSIYAMAALMMAGAAMLASCGNEDTIIDEPQPIAPETPKTYTMTVQATMGGDEATTRALGFDGTKLIATWKKGDIVKVYRVDGGSETYDPVGTLTAQGSGATTTLRGSFNEGTTPTVGGKLRLKFLSNTYTGQKGTLEYIAANCDYATADVTITSVDDGNPYYTGAVTTTPASFENQQAIVKFSLKKPDGTTPFAAKNFMVKYNSSKYRVNLDNASSDIYVAIPGNSSKDVKLLAISNSGDELFNYEKANVTFESGKYYAISVKMSEWDGDLSILPVDYTAKNGEVLTGKLDGKLKLSIAAGATVTLNDVTIKANNSAGITCLGSANIILTGTNSVGVTYTEGVDYYGAYYPGIQPGGTGTTLTISGTGKLIVTGRGSSPGIGTHMGTCGHITISGGTVEASGINSGFEGTCGHITISGGTVTATGYSKNAGIGSGAKGTCGAITISGGTVTATGEKNAVGIGSGDYGNCGNITISGGTIEKAKGGIDAAGIGSGSHGSCGDITISGGTIEKATGGEYAAGIGSGSNGKYTSISIGRGITKVEATGGADYVAPIGKGKNDNGSGYVTIDGTLIDGGSSYSPNNWNPSSLPIANTTDNGHLNWTLNGYTWTLTPKN